MHSKSDSVWCIFSTYVLHKLHNHRLSKETYKNRFLCGCWLCNQLQKHSFLDCKEVDILFLWNCYLGQSHIFHYQHSQYLDCNQPQYKQQVDYPEVQEDMYRLEYDNLPRKLLLIHILLLSMDLHIPVTCKLCQEDNLCLLGIQLNERVD